MTEEKQKPDCVLSDGREIVFDLFAITKREYDSLFNRGQSDEDEAWILSKVSGLTPDEVDNLPLGDWKKFARAFFKKAADPVEADPKN